MLRDFYSWSKNPSREGVTDLFIIRGSKVKGQREHNISGSLLTIKCLPNAGSELVPQHSFLLFLKSTQMSRVDSLTMEEISLCLCNRTLDLLWASSLEENSTKMEVCISTYLLALSRLSLSTDPTHSTISELTATSNRYEVLLERYTTMSPRTETSFSSMVKPHLRGAMLLEMLREGGIVSSLLATKNRFLQQYVQKLHAIGCFHSIEYSRTPSMRSRRSCRITLAPPLLSEESNLISGEGQSWTNGNARPISASPAANGTYLARRGGGPPRLAPLAATFGGGPPPPPLEGAISHSDSVFGGANLNLRVRSLVLWGPSRTGKTLYARSLGRHAYFNLQFNLDALSDTAEYAVFDDIQGGFEFFPAYKGWLGAQKEFTVTDKYRKKKTVHWGKPSIMLMNDDPCTCKGVDYAWLKLNCFIIHVDRQFCYVID